MGLKSNIYSFFYLQEKYFLYFCTPKHERLSCGVTGNTSDFGSEESRFEPWRDNNGEKDLCKSKGLFL